MFIEWRRYSQKPSLPSKIPRCTRGYHEIILSLKPSTFTEKSGTIFYEFVAKGFSCALVARN